jgi:co-chaperonin GroES (HSP10)
MANIRFEDLTVEGVIESLKADGLELPIPLRFRVLAVIPNVVEKTNGGIFLSSGTQQAERETSEVALVVSLGEDAFDDEKKFPNGPTFDVGDWVLLKAYAGRNFKLGKWEFRVINDDTPDARVSGPNAVAKV